MRYLPDILQKLAQGGIVPGGGEAGADGRDAYQLAVDEDNFVGTVTEWLASLKGDKGDQGIQGIPGTDGAPGIPGTDGNDGLDGNDGADGIDGSDGAPGTDGATWVSTSGAPSNGTGADGDRAFDSNGDVYLKAAGVWALETNVKGDKGDTGDAGANGGQGAQGNPGTDGISVLFLSSDPGPGDGVDGQAAINYVTWTGFKKTGASWDSGTSLIGPQGDQGVAGDAGSRWYATVGQPLMAFGENGDRALDDTTGQVYLKTAGMWAPEIMLKGADGDDGADGIDGNDGAPGIDGTSVLSTTGQPGNGVGNNDDRAFDGATGQMYLKSGGSWAPEIMLKGVDGNDGTDGIDGDDGAPGAPGTPGTDGVDGADGATWLPTTGVPSNGVGNDGDFAIDSGDGQVYLKTAGTWGVDGNIKGVAGNDGADGVDGSDGAAGTPGVNGTDGATWIATTGQPESGVGNNGDRAFDSADGEVYLKTLGSWASESNIRGTKWHATSGTPSGSIGVEGDYAFDAATGQTYERGKSSWTSSINLTGPAGNDGADGTDGVDGSDGTQWDANGSVTGTRSIDFPTSDLLLLLTTGSIFLNGQFISCSGNQYGSFIVVSAIDFTTAEPAAVGNNLYINTVTGTGSTTTGQTFTANNIYRAAADGTWAAVQVKAGSRCWQNDVGREFRWNGVSWVDMDVGRVIESPTAPADTTATWRHTVDEVDYVYHDALSEWVSRGEHTLNMGQGTAIAAGGGHYLQVDGVSSVTSTETGWPVPFDIKVTSVHWRNEDDTTGWTHRINKWDESAGSDGVAWSVSPAGTYNHFTETGLDVDFDEEDIMGFSSVSGTATLDDQNVTITYRRRPS